MSALHTYDGFNSLEWLAGLLETKSTSHIGESFGGQATKKGGGAKDDAAGCFAYMKKECKPEMQAIITLVVEHYIDFDNHRDDLWEYGELYLINTKINALIGSKIALERAMNVTAYNANAELIMLAYDVPVSKRAYNKNWMPHIRRLTSHYHNILGLADMYAREYKKKYYRA